LVCQVAHGVGATTSLQHPDNSDRARESGAGGTRETREEKERRQFGDETDLEAETGEPAGASRQTAKKEKINSCARRVYLPPLNSWNYFFFYDVVKKHAVYSPDNFSIFTNLQIFTAIYMTPITYIITIGLQ